MKKLLGTALLAIAVWAVSPVAALAQQQVSGVPLEYIQPFDPLKPLLQEYCSPNQITAGTNMVEWQPASGKYWSDPTRIKTPVCYVDCTGQLHCTTPCSSVFASGCSSSPSPGTVTSFSAGDLSPLFTTSVATPTTTPALTFNLTNAAAFTLLANNTAASAPYQFITFDSLFGSCSSPNQALIFNTTTHAFGCNTITHTSVCMIRTGADNAALPLVSADLGPQPQQCFIPDGGTVVEVDVSADAGVPSALVQWTSTSSVSSDLTAAALSTGASGGIACANAAGSGTGLSGATCSVALTNASITAGSYIGMDTGSVADGTAKRVTVAVSFTVSP
jgi:hypothetical protein